MIDKSIEQKSEADGRSIQINTGFYNIQVWGDPEDSIEDVEQMAQNAADRAKADIKELDDTINPTTSSGVE